MIKLVCNSDRNEYDIRPLVMSFFPGENMEYTISDACDIKNNMENKDTIYIVLEDLNIHISIGGIEKKVSYDEIPDTKLYRDDLKRNIYMLLSEVTGKVNSWGTLTGVRPSKIPMMYLREGENFENVKEHMMQHYFCSEEKAQLCTEVAANEIRILDMIEYEKGYSVYIGIPFCPTVCNYCSFASISLAKTKNAGDLMRAYMQALEKECISAKDLFSGKRISSLYIGGGTPTAFDEECLEWLMRIVKENFVIDEQCEFCVEAGRPDSINREKLLILKNAGVTRISINPQTMKPETLKLMGRNHSVEQVREIFELARTLGFDNINMDLIAGLMGETPEDFSHTLDEIKKLSPDSFTVHSLVVKRASEYRTQCEANDSAQNAQNNDGNVVEKMLDMAADFAREYGYMPYYMYRQKNKAGLGTNSVLENVGYAKAGKESVYNIVIMEEKQSILAFGAGASSKFLFGDRLERVANVKNVNEYISRIDEMTERKKRGLYNE